MTTESPRRHTRPIDSRIADYQRDLTELRAAMDARARLDPESQEYAAALAHEDELLERIHTWSLGEASR
jgi:hypothetical protein